MRKKGDVSIIEILVVIVLLVILMVVLVIGFTTGWGDFWNKIINIGGGKSNVQAVIQGCQVACSTESSYDYCKRERDVVFEKDDEEKNGKYTCDQLARSFLKEDLRGCDKVLCFSKPKKCEDLKSDLCMGEEECKVHWMNTGKLEERLKSEVGVEKTWKSIEKVPTSYISDEDKAANSASTCVKAVLNL